MTWQVTYGGQIVCRPVATYVCACVCTRVHVCAHV